MSTSFKSMGSRILYFLLGAVLLLATVFMFKLTFSGKSTRTYRQQKTEKEFLYATIVLALASTGSFLLAFTKRKEWKPENEVIKLTGNKINRNTEVSVNVERFRIEPLLKDSIYKCIKTRIVYHGEQKQLIIFLADEAEYDKIVDAKKIKVVGELRDEVSNLEIKNARLHTATPVVSI